MVAKKVFLVIIAHHRILEVQFTSLRDIKDREPLTCIKRSLAFVLCAEPVRLILATNPTQKKSKLREKLQERLCGGLHVHSPHTYDLCTRT